MNILIEKQPYGKDHFILFFSKNGKDKALGFMICEFENEMNLLLYECEMKSMNGRTGFVFPNTPKFLKVKGAAYINCLYEDIEWFANNYGLDKEE